MNKIFEELVCLRAARGAVGPWAGEGAAGDGGPGDQAYTGVLTVRDLGTMLTRCLREKVSTTYHFPLFLTVNEVVVVLHTKLT